MRCAHLHRYVIRRTSGIRLIEGLTSNDNFLKSLFKFAFKCLSTGNWMKFDIYAIHKLRRERNPMDELLTEWGTYNHTILELFVLLSKMEHYQAMVVLKPFVEEKFHALIDRGERNFRKMLRLNKENKNSKDLKIGAQNFNENVLRPAGAPKVVISEKSKEGSHKILNNPVQVVAANDQGPSDSNNLLVATPIPGSRLSPVLLQAASSSKNINSLPFINTESALPQILYEELATATDLWSMRNILGKGGFGTVYKGIWKNTAVAIKKIERREADADNSYIVQLQQSLREIKILNARPHENILQLYAYSLEGEAPCLVYQFMKNGSLEERLSLRHRSAPLTWLQRHEIAKGTARGLQYLHTIGSKPLIHGDIKSANILLDKNFEPKIGDFGLAREGPETESMKVSKVHGTRPYLPDEFLRGKTLSTKIDTYSYGIVLFELATGLSAYDESRAGHKFLKDFIDSWNERELELLIDQKANLEHKEVYANLIVIGKWCSNRLAKDRPPMDLVYNKLNCLG